MQRKLELTRITPSDRQIKGHLAAKLSDCTPASRSLARPQETSNVVVLEPEVVTRLSLTTPLSLGSVIRNDPPVRTSTAKLSEADAEAMINVLWQDVKFSVVKPFSNEKARGMVWESKFYVAFERSIDSSTTFRGTINVDFKGAISGLSGATYFNAVGMKEDGEASGEFSRKTHIDIDFALSGASLALHREMVVTDEVRRSSVGPNHTMITGLTNELSKQGFYIRSIVQTDESPSQRRAWAVNRYWDIESRWYEGLYPIDVHLVVKGEGANDRQEGWCDGETSIDIFVRGTVANSDMEAKVDEVMAQVSTCIKGVLDEWDRAAESELRPSYSDVVQPVQAELMPPSLDLLPKNLSFA